MQLFFGPSQAGRIFTWCEGPRQQPHTTAEGRQVYCRVSLDITEKLKKILTGTKESNQTVLL